MSCFWVGDTHVHTAVSDGELSPGQVALIAVMKGLDFIAVTDHQTVLGAAETRRQAEDTGLPLTVLTGQEVQCENHVHFVVLGYPGSLPETKVAAIPSLADEVHAEGGAVILAHPWTAFNKPTEFLEQLDGLFATGKVDALEIYTSSLKVPKFDLWHRMVSRYWQIWRAYDPGIVGSTDWHHRNHGLSIGLGQTYVQAEHPDEARLITAIRECRTIAAVSQPLAEEAMVYERLEEEIFDFAVDDGPTCWRGRFCGPSPLVDEVLATREQAVSRLSALPAASRDLAALRHAAMTAILGGNYRRALDLTKSLLSDRKG